MSRGRLSATSRSVWGLSISLGLLLLSIPIAVSVGEAPLPVSRAFAILLDGLGLFDASAWPSWQHTVVLTVRLPRVLLAALAGGGLALSGAVMQAVFRNPMADPSIVGVSGGAAFGAVLALYGGGAVGATLGISSAAISLYAVPISAFVGALVVAALVYTIATSRGTTPITTLLLSGIAVGGIANALTSFVLSLTLAEWEVGRQMLSWLMGGLEGRSWQHVALATPLVLGGSAWLLAYARDMNVLLTGEESALSVGIDVGRTKRHLIAVASLVTAATVAVIGIVAFVGLMVPHIVRLSVGADHRRLLPISFLAGSLFLVWGDLACRALPLADLRLGVVTALAGGPFFLYLLVRHRTTLRTLA